MDFFNSAKTVRLRSHREKYLVAGEDREHVFHDRKGSSSRSSWSVELAGDAVRLKSCYGRYLTASTEPFLLGFTGNKVVQTLPSCLGPAVEWEPVRDGVQVRLKTRGGNFLRANHGLPPYRRSVTHDVPKRTITQDWVLWDVEVVDTGLQYATKALHPRPPPLPRMPADLSVSSEASSPRSSPSPSPSWLSRFESSFSFTGSLSSSPSKTNGREIHYCVADDVGNVDVGVKKASFNFSGTNVEDLAHRLEEETGLQDIIVCFRSPLNGALSPLFLHLPPNKADVHVVVVQASSKVAKTFKRLECSL